MERGYKIFKELCNQCKYEMNISTGYGNSTNTGKFCGYSLIECKCRTVDEKGKIIDDSREYCTVFEKRVGNKRINPGRTDNDDVFGGD